MPTIITRGAVSAKAYGFGVSGGYSVGNSLRFRRSATAYLNRTFGTATNNKKWTWSGWVKRGILDSGTNIYGLLSAYAGVSNTYGYIDFYQDGIRITDYTTGTQNITFQTTQVFRDPSAWYHILIAVDTTQSTSNNRLFMYVNGAQVTSFSSAVYPTLNSNTNINSAIATYLGNDPSNSPGYFDGYLAEVNFIDGQALTPSSFGTYDTNGVWQPVKYSGSFGTNGFYLPFSLNNTSTYAGSFNGTSQWISTPSSATFNLSTGNWTIEGWYFATGTNSNNARYMVFVPASGAIYGIIPSSSTDFNLNQFGTSNVFSTTNGSLSLNTWQHIALVKNGTTTTLYVDGVASASSTTAWPVNSNTTLFFGGVNGTYTAYFPGKISNVRVVMGTAVYTSNFIPSTSPLTAITNTQLLTLQNSTIIDNSGNSVAITNTGSVTTAVDTPFVANITNDASGNNNNWFSQNISLTAGTTYDSMTDSPTVSSASVANYAVLNPLMSGNLTGPSSSGNLNTQGGGATWQSIQGTLAFSSGKFYYEATVLATDNTTNIIIGAGTNQVGKAGLTGNFPGNNAYSWGVQFGAATYKINNGTFTNIGTSYSFTTGDVLQVAVDVTNGNFWVGKNNTWLVSGNPSTGSNPLFTNVTGAVTAQVALYDSNNQLACNFGQQPFTYTPPTGFNALNTYNLPTPTIANGAQYMAATLWTGNGTSQAINNGTNNTIGTTFQPDFIWIKDRSVASAHALTNSVVGTTKYLESNTTNAETTDTTSVTAINSNGFNLGAGTATYYTNKNGDSFVGWQWKANGSGVSNTNGSITSTVSANTTAGFSVVTYTGTGANATVGHGLGVAPNFIILKSRNNVDNWYAYHSFIGNTGAVFPNLTNATITNSGYWNNTSPTSSVFSVGTITSFSSSWTYVAYCWAAVAGYSAFGSYTGNGSTDGPFVYTGFRPRFILIKRTDAAYNWFIFDSSENASNAAQNYLQPNSSAAQGGTTGVDLLSNGFKWRDTSIEINASGGTYIYAAFAENPLNYSRAR
jgi:hypothetical protein